MSPRPKGTVTFLFTDVEGSTQLLRQLREGYGAALEQHQRLLREAFAAHGGEEVDTQGDAFFYVFSRARDAADAAAAGQRALAAGAWPQGTELRVRMGMHTGEPVLSAEGRYHGMGVHRTARIMAAGHGGQILASQSTASLLGDDALDGVTLHDLGLHRLKDLAQPERIYELSVDGLPNGFPALTTENKPRTPFYRRPVVVGGFVGVLAAAVAIPVFAFGRGDSSGSSLSAVSANSVGVLDPKDGSIDDEVPDVPSPARVASGAGSIWVTSSAANSVYRIDAGSHQLRQTIRVGNDPNGIAYGDGKVWVANTLDGTVSRIDPDANDVTGEPIRVGNSPTAVAFGFGSAWVTNVDDGSVSRIEPASGGVKTIAIRADGRGIAVGAGSVWITDGAENLLVRVDPASNEVTQTIGVGSGPTAVAFGAGAVWVANTLDGTVSRVDPASNQVRAVVSVGASPASIAVATDAVWVANETGRTLVRLDPRTGNVAQTVHTGARPSGLTAAGSLWVAAQASAASSHRGGTLHVALFTFDGVVDPAISYDPVGWNLLSTTNDGLVAFRRVGGGEGTQIVPDLARSLPTPTDGGKTYAFQLRRGIRYSTGALLRPTDVRATFERLFKNVTQLEVPLNYYTGILGGADCVKRPHACDLSRGIVANDKTGTVTFHLAAPDSDFLYKLGIPFAFVLPARTPISKGGKTPVPATGPYVLRNATTKRLEFVRNRQFRVWDSLARPAGFPDELQVSISSGSVSQHAIAAVARGRSDLATLVLLPVPVAQFENQHPAQVHRTPTAGTLYWFLNTSVRPFSDVRARRAVNYALERDALADSPEVGDAQPTCQVLPPNFPGYRPYCPYTVNPHGGAWTAPDLARARELVRESGTAGTRVAFWLWKGPNGSRQARVARRVFTQLGYRVTIKTFADLYAYVDALKNSGAHGPQAGAQGLFGDYPAPSTFFAYLSCASVGDHVNNAARFCSPKLDAEVKRASAFQTRDPRAAAQLWAKVDRDATDLAFVAPTATPRAVDIVSKRVGNYQHHPLWGVLLDQLWVR